MDFYFFSPVWEKTAQERGKEPLFSGGTAAQGALVAIIIFAILTTNRIFSGEELKIMPWICGSSLAVQWQQSMTLAGSLTAQTLWMTNLPLGKSLLVRLVQYYSLYYTVHLRHQVSKPALGCLKNLHNMKLVRWKISCHFLWQEECCSWGCREKFRAWFNTAFK